MDRDRDRDRDRRSAAPSTGLSRLHAHIPMQSFEGVSIIHLMLTMARYNDRDSSRFEGDTYRPGERSNDRPRGPTRELFRDRVPRDTPRDNIVDSYVPGRRDRSPPPQADTWRRRSRSPRGDDRYRGEYRDRSRERQRSPPRRNFSPPRNIDRYRAPSPRRARSPLPRARTPLRDSRYTPRRDRSPFPAKRSRDVSPIDRRERSPPPKRERLASPVIRSRNFRYAMA